jgi:hypothetical protein
MKKTILLSFAFLMITAPGLCQDLTGGVSNKGNVLSSTTGRFVFGQISEFARHQFMLDTQTGELWQLVAGEDKVPKLQPVMYIYGEDSYLAPSFFWKADLSPASPKKKRK